MKILLITSTYQGIYDHFESWIVNELRKKHEVAVFQAKNRLSVLQSLTKSFKPEVALTLVGFKLPVQFIHWLKSHGVKTAVWFTEDPYFMDRTAQLSRHYDFVFTIDSAALQFYKNSGHKQAFFLPLAANPAVFQPKEVSAAYKSDICLVGFPYPERVNYVKQLLRNSPFKVQVVGNWSKYLYMFRNHPKLKIHEGWVKPEVVNNFYNGAKIVLNTHRPFNLKENQNKLGIAGTSINNRTFDVAASGAFQLIEFKEDLPNHFIEDEEIVSFRNYQEFIRKVEYYIHFEDERKKIADNARFRALKEHTFKQRLNNMHDMIKNAD